MSAPWVAKISLKNGAIELARNLSLKKHNKSQGEKGALEQRPLMRPKQIIRNFLEDFVQKENNDWKVSLYK